MFQPQKLTDQIFFEQRYFTFKVKILCTHVFGCLPACMCTDWVDFFCRLKTDMCFKSDKWFLFYFSKLFFPLHDLIMPQWICPLLVDTH